MLIREKERSATEGTLGKAWLLEPNRNGRTRENTGLYKGMEHAVSIKETKEPWPHIRFT